MSHLTPSEIVDALDGTLTPVRQAHARECAACRRDLDSLARLLSETSVEVPEPSPLFWERFSDRVRAAIAAEPASRPRPWFEWPVLAPIASLALVLLALGTAISREPLPIAPADVTASASDLDDATDEAAIEAVWALASDLVGADADVPDSDLVVAPGSAERAAVHLSSAEQQELMRLIQEELGKSGG